MQTTGHGAAVRLDPGVTQAAQPVPGPYQPVRPPWRALKAYWITFVVVSSYLWHRFWTRGRRQTASMRARLDRCHRRNARRIYRGIVELQGLYIKVGQLFSIMTNVLPEAFRGGLACLQDQVAPRPYPLIEQRVRDEFGGRAPLEIFAEFDRDAIASASIGQVHLARLPTGQRVAVKVQYPGIEEIVRSDLITLQRIFAIVHHFMPSHGLDAVYEEIREMILQELDFTREAENARRIAKNLEGRSDTLIPPVIDELCTSRILTTAFVEGVKANDLEGLATLGVDRKRLARLVIESYCEQIFRHGLYHADPHPGNILVASGPTIQFVDFGAVAALSDGMREGLVSLLQGALNRDTDKIINALRTMGFLAHRADPRVFDRVVEYFHDRLHREFKLRSFNLSDLKFDPEQALDNLADLHGMNISLGDITDTFRVPKDWIMLERTILLLTGLCTELDPELNPVEVIRPYIEAFVLGEEGDWSRLLLDTGRDVVLSLVSLPAEIRNFTTRATQGQIQVKVTGQLDAARLHYAIGHQLIYTALLLGSGTAAAYFDGRGEGTALRASLIAGGCCLLLLLRSFWKTRRWLRKRR